MIGVIRAPCAREMIAELPASIQFMGEVAVCRDIHLLGHSARGGHGPKTFSPGVTFVIAVAAATNFLLFFGLIESLITGPRYRRME